MTSYRRSVSLPHLVCASGSRGAYEPDDPGKPGGGPDGRDHGPAPDPGRDPDDPGPAAGSPLPGLADALDVLEAAKRRVLDRYRDVAAWGGTAQTTGYTQAEWLTLVGRVPGREQWKYQLLARRLPGLPVTAALYASGELSFDQAVTIVAGTKRLSGDTLADVEATAADAAVARNRRGDDPDVDADVEQLVQQTRTAAEQDRTDRNRLDRNQVRIQPDLFGAGRITEDWADPRRVPDPPGRDRTRRRPTDARHPPRHPTGRGVAGHRPRLARRPHPPPPARQHEHRPRRCHWPRRS